jgi:hypothetical protein
MSDHEASAETPPEDTFETRMRGLTEAAGFTDPVIRDAFADLAHACWPRTIHRLAALLRRMRTVAPDRIGPCPVVAFIRYGRAEGMRPERGAAITADRRDRYNVHTVFWDESTARWEGQNGRYGVTWPVALNELVDRAEREVQP